MPVYLLGPGTAFPPPDRAEDGIIAVGGDLSSERLLAAYRAGIFPWYGDGMPILWHSPDPRCVIDVARVHVGRTLRRVLAKGRYAVKYDTAFESVIRACKGTPRPGQDGTWITDDMERAYVGLHALGYAHSVETYDDSGRLAGGLYGVSLGRVFFGESMFSWQDDASKVALVTLARKLAAWGFRLMDAQVATPQTLALGAEEWPRSRFLAALAEAMAHPTRKGNWGVESSPAASC